MSSLLKLAKDLELKSSAQASDTEQMLRRAFSEHEKSVSEALNSSGKRICDAIAAHTDGMNAALQSHQLNVLRMVGRTWLTITGITFLLLATDGSMLWYQGSLIVSNLETISRQNDTLAKQAAKTWGVTYIEDRNGRFLVLPEGTVADPAWTVGKGKAKRNALKLVQKQE